MFDDEGANRALVDGRRAGKIRHIGFTGHKNPHIHLHMLAVAREHGFLFDTVQNPAWLGAGPQRLQDLMP